MHVMIATDGSLDPTKVAGLAARLAGDDGRITVYAVVEVPRGLLDDMRASTVDPAEEVAAQVSAEFRSKQAGTAPASHWVGDQALLDQYVRSQVADRTGALADAVVATGVACEVVGEEGEDAARSVLDAIRARDVDVVCIGTHGLGRFEGLLGSLSTKVARHASCSVVLVR